MPGLVAGSSRVCTVLRVAGGGRRVRRWGLALCCWRVGGDRLGSVFCVFWISVTLSTRRCAAGGGNVLWMRVRIVYGYGMRLREEIGRMTYPSCKAIFGRIHSANSVAVCKSGD